MKIRHFLLAAILTASLPATADFKTVAEAYEVALSDVRIPATPSSGIIFKTCADCEPMSVRVTPDTRYQVNGKTYPLKEFRARVFDIRDRAATPVSILHHLESDVILSVSVFE